LAGKIAVSTGRGIETVAREIIRAISILDVPENVKDHVARNEKELLARLRGQMLLAKSEFELRYTAYELNEHLARYPHSPEAKMLKDIVAASIERNKLIIPSSDHVPRKFARNRRSTLFYWAISLGISIVVVAWVISKLSK
ncbi:MAG: hypothetical protein ACKO5M_11400, partial [Vulcanococcus sp.]